MPVQHAKSSLRGCFLDVHCSCYDDSVPYDYVLYLDWQSRQDSNYPREVASLSWVHFQWSVRVVDYDDHQVVLMMRPSPEEVPFSSYSVGKKKSFVPQSVDHWYPCLHDYVP